MTRFDGLLSGMLAGGLILALGCQEPKVGPTVTPLGFSPLVVEPAAATLTTGQGADFKARALDGSHPTVAWDAPRGGTVDPSGHYQAPAAPGTYEVQAKAHGLSASSKVTVVAPPRGPVTGPAHVWAGAQGLVASVPDQPGSTYAWKIEGGILQGGARGASATFDAGMEGKVTLTCRVVNAAGRGLDTSLEIPLVAKVSLTISPASAVVTAGTARKFGFNLEGGVSGEVDWSVAESGGGSVDASGRYQAPAVPGVYTVQVASREDPTVKDSMTVKVVPAPAGAIRGPGATAPLAKGLKASVPDQPGCTYAWTLTGGTLTGGQDQREVTFDAGEGPELKLACDITNEAGDSFQATLVVALGK